MALTNREKNLARALVVILVLGVLGALTVWGVQNANGGGGGQFRQIGEQMESELKSGRIPQSYAYVADIKRKLYWPNDPKYASTIPEDDRVYILNAEALEKFKGYEAGPR